MRIIRGFDSYEVVPDEAFQEDYQTFLKSVYEDNENGYYTRYRLYERKRSIFEGMFDKHEPLIKSDEGCRHNVKWLKSRLFTLMEKAFVIKGEVKTMLENISSEKNKYPLKDIESVFLFKVDRNVNDVLNDMFTNVIVVLDNFKNHYDKINTISINSFNEKEFKFKQRFISMFWRYIEIHMNYIKWIIDSYNKFLILWNEDDVLKEELMEFRHGRVTYGDKNVFETISNIQKEVHEEYSIIQKNIKKYFKDIKDQCGIIIEAPDDKSLEGIKVMNEVLMFSCNDLHGHLCTTISEIGALVKPFQDYVIANPSEPIGYEVRKVNVTIFFMLMLQNRVAAHYITQGLLEPDCIESEKTELEKEDAEKARLGNMISGEKEKDDYVLSERDMGWDEFGAEDQ